MEIWPKFFGFLVPFSSYWQLAAPNTAQHGWFFLNKNGQELEIICK
jgi:hypothetical protein